MPIRKLRKIDGSGGVTLPKDDLGRDGLLDDDGKIKDAQFAIDRVGEGEYRIKEVDLDDF